MSKTFDPTKPVRTRDGLEARVVCTDARGAQPVVALIIEDYDGGEVPHTYGADGTWMSGQKNKLDLVNIPEKHVRWAVISLDDSAAQPRQGSAYLYPEKPADLNCIGGIGRTRVACIRIEFEEGEGL